MNDRRQPYADLWWEVQQLPISLFFADRPDRMARNHATDAQTMSPGYVGRNYRPGGWLLMGNFPGGGGEAYSDRRDPHDDALYGAIRSLQSATNDSERNMCFDQLCDAWIHAQQGHRLYRNVIRPALTAAALEAHDVAFLNMFPFRCAQNEPPTAAMRQTAWSEVVSRQLELLAPGRIIALGKAAGNLLGRYYKGNATITVLPRAIGDTRLTPEARAEIDQLRTTPAAEPATAPAPSQHVAKPQVQRAIAYEQRGAFFQALFDALGIEYETVNGKIKTGTLLRYRNASLNLYYNEATRSRGAFFAANQNRYRGFAWLPDWLEARNDRQEAGHFKVIPYPGEETQALQRLLDYAGEPVRT